MSLRLRCTVRGCGRPLELGASAASCAAGHAFDRAREGYWNLLQPQDRRAARPGDRAEAVEARRRWLARGLASGLVAELARRVDALGLPAGAAAVDLGCGEGTITTQVLGGRGLEACGVDLSTHAIRLACRGGGGILWIVANADRELPFADASVDLALSLFGRRPARELRRVVAPGGTLVVAVPAEDDLIELRAAALGEAERRDRVGGAVAELSGGFELRARATWRHVAAHDRAALDDALAMTYRGARRSERTRLGDALGLDVTLAAEILVLVAPGRVG